MPGLDGLRAIAVLAVIFYHMNLGAVPGGFLGVGVFFVLSGYLITDLLASEWRQQGRIDLKSFWIRRFRRLLPALAAFLMTVTAWTLFMNTSQLLTLLGNVLSAALYINNWWLIFHQVSYFDSFGPPSPVGHLWSLAVEEQFYVLWPFLMLLGFRYVKRRGRLFGLILAGEAASAVAMAVLYVPGSDPSRVYYGTDTRAFGLLIGAALAIVWPSAKLTEASESRSRRTIDLIGGAGLLTILVMIWRVSEFDAFLYPGGFVLLSIAAAAAVAALAHPASRLGLLLSWKPLRWLGTRSYGLYLWHYFVICITNPVIHTGGINPALIVIQFILSIGFAELSWRLVENPFRSGKARQMWTNILKRTILSHQANHRRASHRWRAVAWTMPLLIIMILIAVNRDLIIHVSSATSITDSDTVQIPGASTEGVSRPSGPEYQQQPDIGRVDTDGNEGSSRKEVTDKTEVPIPVDNSSEPEAMEKPDSSELPGNAEKPSSITAIGDSVLLGAASELEELLPGIIVDAKIGRQLSQAAEAAAELKAKGKLGSRVIIELGTNGLFTKKQLRALLESLQDAHQIILVNTRVPRKWEQAVNDTLKQVAADYANAVVVDWYKASMGHDSYFQKDGVHLKPKGAKAYAALIASAVGPITE
ncbi:acetyltransferase [Paenibacillus mendelii]|nr:acetyltransferase [Paenibacillus mendelii]